MTAPFEVEATINGGPLDGRRMVVTVHREHNDRPYNARPILTAKVEIGGEMVPIDIARTVLAHTERTGT